MGRWLIRAGRAGLTQRLDGLLQSYAFAPIAEVFAAQLALPTGGGEGDRAA
jgi:hypothetical protein